MTDNGGLDPEKTVVNASFEATPKRNGRQSAYINQLVELGYTVVAAAGNTGPDYYSVMSPGVAHRAITVGAIDKLQNLANFSAEGPHHTNIE